MGLIHRSVFEPHPEGLSILTLVDVEMDEKGHYGPQLKWQFDSEEQMADGRLFRMTYWTSPVINEKSNLYKLLKAFGEDPDDERWEEIEDVREFEFLFGRKIQGNVIHKKVENGVNARLDTVLPMKTRKATPNATQRQELHPAQEIGTSRGAAREQPAARQERVSSERRQPVGAAAAGGEAGIWKDED